jgi:hypothetical protein
MTDKEIQRELDRARSLDPALRYWVFMDYIRDRIDDADYLIAEIEAVRGRKENK